MENKGILLKVSKELHNHLVRLTYEFSLKENKKVSLGELVKRAVLKTYPFMEKKHDSKKG